MIGMEKLLKHYFLSVILAKFIQYPTGVFDF